MCNPYNAYSISPLDRHPTIHTREHSSSHPHARSVRRDPDWDETFSEAVERHVGGTSLLEIAGILSDEEADAGDCASRRPDQRNAEARGVDGLGR
ncbi:hypothetical protein GBQ70_14950 [Halomicrobium sp. ZPS1]|uniref:Uncharacterized protein n=1 Tax=Halomicrobium mukohataei TaxID=57705 RepID=A0A4D6KPT5_9EURY|nr:hypothetical protein E5139_14930 [Halomicrobium mukohataei]QFR21686.1 hypothetical protein GBQ70_14950 [Halomicrobium sp. ZPS1]